MALLDVEGTRTLHVPKREPWGPNYPVRFQFPDVIDMCSDWTNYTTESLAIGGNVLNSGRMFKANSIRDPDFNRGDAEGSAVDYLSLLASGYRYWFVKRAEVRLQVWTSSASQLNNYYKLAAFAIDEDTPLPGPDAHWSELQFVFPKMKAVDVAHPYAERKTNLSFDIYPYYNWPARHAMQDPDNWGTFGSLTSEGQDPVNVLNFWAGLAMTTNVTGTSAITFYMKTAIRFHIVCVRDTQIRHILPV